MRISLHTQGGFGFFPGRSAPVIVDTAELDAAEADRLEDLVRRARLRGRPEPGAARVQLPDARRYVLAVEDAAGRDTVSVDEPIDDPALADLISELRRHARGPH